MSVVRGLPVEELKRRGSIKDTDVTRLRRTLFERGPLVRDEAEALIAINAACRLQDTAWSDVFIDAVSDFIVNRETPEGYLTADNCGWLIARFSIDGRVRTKTELELLVRVLERARWVPESLSLFALDQMLRAVVAGNGPMRGGKIVLPGQITDTEVALVRRILIAFAGGGRLAITHREAEMLFAIEEALHGEAPPAMWADLFSKAIANALMSAVGHRIPPREEALKTAVGPESGADAAMWLAANLGEIWPSYQEQSREERAIEMLERRRIEIITNEDIVPIEAGWIADRLTGGSGHSAHRLALIGHLTCEVTGIGDVLRPLVNRVGAAA